MKQKGKQVFKLKNILKIYLLQIFFNSNEFSFFIH